MGKLQERRRFLGAALSGLLVPTLPACGGDDDPEPPPNPVSEAQITAAIAQIDTLAANLMASSGVPGMAIAVVRGNQTAYARGFGRRSSSSLGYSTCTSSKKRSSCASGSA